MLSVGEKDTIQYLLNDNAMTFKGRYSVCSNPLCTCCNIDFISDNRNDQLLAPEVRVSLNVKAKEAAKLHTKSVDEHLSRQIVNDLTNDDWQFLARLFLDKKIAYTDQADLGSLDIPFPMDEIEEEALLVSYNGILPFTPVITLDIDGLKLKIEDLYCVRKGCTCQEVNLIFSPVNNDNIILPFMSENTEEMCVVYNTKKNEWTLDNIFGLQLNPNDVMSKLSNLMDINSFFSLRHRQFADQESNPWRRHCHRYIGKILLEEIRLSLFR
ncbi:MAG: hypothetical protein EHM72_09535 [Calditrichaeota bacterium]|nr:MAG: hypothetical protein EHM72_09535 [Calditrichota bacterium]